MVKEYFRINWKVERSLKKRKIVKKGNDKFYYKIRIMDVDGINRSEEII